MDRDLNVIRMGIHLLNIRDFCRLTIERLLGPYYRGSACMDSAFLSGRAATTKQRNTLFKKKKTESY